MDNYKKLFEPYVDFSLESTCLRDVVYKGLKKAIVEGRIQTGSRIVEKRFADQMNISRTPVREALKRLENEGLVEHVPNVGSVVRCMDEQEVISLYTAREALESIVFPKVIENVDENELDMLRNYLYKTEMLLDQKGMEGVAHCYMEFQDYLIGLGQNRMIFGMLKNLDKSYDRFRKQIDYEREDYKKIVYVSHHLVDALASKNIDEVFSVNRKRRDVICECLLNKLD